MRTLKGMTTTCEDLGKVTTRISGGRGEGGGHCKVLRNHECHDTEVLN